MKKEIRIQEVQLTSLPDKTIHFNDEKFQEYIKENNLEPDYNNKFPLEEPFCRFFVDEMLPWYITYVMEYKDKDVIEALTDVIFAEDFHMFPTLIIDYKDDGGSKRIQYGLNYVLKIAGYTVRTYRSYIEDLFD